jgi:CheY-like chemotaxis protein
MNGQPHFGVMVAEHNAWTRHSIATNLRQAGLSVLEASNGVSALRRAVAEAPQVVIVGPALPEMSAPELIDGLRAEPRTQHTAIVGVSDVAGADASLDVTCSADDLLATIVEARETRLQALAAAPIRSVIASARGT